LEFWPKRKKGWVRVWSLHERPRLSLFLVTVAEAEVEDASVVDEAAREPVDSVAVLERVIDCAVEEAVVGFTVLELVVGFMVEDGVDILEVIVLLIVETVVDLIMPSLSSCRLSLYSCSNRKQSLT